MRRIERALLLIGVLCLGWVAAIYLFARFDQAQQNSELDELRARRTAPRKATDVVLPAPKPPDSQPKVRTRPAAGALIGRVEVPRLGVSAIVREGVDTGTLRKAVGHVPETALPGEDGNAALAAHRDTFFRGLKHVREGDRVQVTTPEGVFQYQVAKTRIVNPEDVSVLDPTSEPTLTLITCYPFNFVGSAPQRFIVTATAARQNTRVVAQRYSTARPKLPALMETSSVAERFSAESPAKPALKRSPAASTRPARRLSSDHRKITRRAALKERSRPSATTARGPEPPRGDAAVAPDPPKRKSSVWSKLARIFKPKPPRSTTRTSAPANPDLRIP